MAHLSLLHSAPLLLLATSSSVIRTRARMSDASVIDNNDEPDAAAAASEAATASLANTLLNHPSFNNYASEHAPAAATSPQGGVNINAYLTQQHQQIMQMQILQQQQALLRQAQQQAAAAQSPTGRLAELHAAHEQAALLRSAAALSPARVGVGGPQLPPPQGVLGGLNSTAFAPGTLGANLSTMMVQKSPHGVPTPIDGADVLQFAGSVMQGSPGGGAMVPAAAQVKRKRKINRETASKDWGGKRPRPPQPAKDGEPPLPTNEERVAAALAAAAAEGLELERTPETAGGYRGVSYEKGKKWAPYRAKVCTIENGKQHTHSLGCFPTAEEAALAFARLAPVKAPNRGKPRPSGGTSRDYAGTSTSGGLSSTVKQAAKAFLEAEHKTTTVQEDYVKAMVEGTATATATAASTSTSTDIVSNLLVVDAEPPPDVSAHSAPVMLVAEPGN